MGRSILVGVVFLFRTFSFFSPLLVYVQPVLSASDEHWQQNEGRKEKHTQDGFRITGSVLAFPARSFFYEGAEGKSIYVSQASINVIFVFWHLELQRPSYRTGSPAA
jgi:hypothetical protein